MRPQVTENSVESWRDIKPRKLSKRRQSVYDALRDATQPVTGREIAEHVCIDGAWKRLPELERLGLAKRVGTRKCSITGRSAQTWTRVL